MKTTAALLLITLIFPVLPAAAKPDADSQKDTPPPQQAEKPIHNNADTAATIRAMEHITVTPINFHEAGLQEVVKYMNGFTEPTMCFSSPVINFMLQPELLEQITKEQKSGTSDSDRLSPAATVTFKVRQTTLKGLLDIFTILSNTRYIILGNTVWICAKNAPPVTDALILPDDKDRNDSQDTPLQLYNAELSITAPGMVCSFSKEEQKNPGDNINRSLMDFFSEHGVTWPDGAYIKTPTPADHSSVIKPAESIFVRNTLENITLMMRIIKQLRPFPYQIRINLYEVAFKIADIQKLGPSITQEKIISLWTKGAGKLLAAPSVVADAGQQATLKGVTEYIYPTEFSINTASNRNGSAAFIALPEAFETREVGSILEVLAETNPAGLIVLTLSPEQVDPPVWQDYGCTNGTSPEVYMPQPFFHSNSLLTSIMLKSGSTVMIGGGAPARDGKNLIYFFISATLVDTEGKPLSQSPVPNYTP